MTLPDFPVSWLGECPTWGCCLKPTITKPWVLQALKCFKIARGWWTFISSFPNWPTPVLSSERLAHSQFECRFQHRRWHLWTNTWPRWSRCSMVLEYFPTSLPILDTVQTLLVSRYSHWYQKTKGFKYPSKIDLDIKIINISQMYVNIAALWSIWDRTR